MEILIRPGLTYIHKTDHRDGSRQKSQWIISQLDERGSFILMYDSNWKHDHIGWGLHIQDRCANYLGTDNTGTYHLIVAKFVDGDRIEKWHGYPADHTYNPQDIPSRDILWQWKNMGYIGTCKVRKILKGQRCNL
jgi:hypothetical protein